MSDTRTEKITREEESRAVKIARLASQLPEREQEKIYYMLKGIELAGSQGKNQFVTRAAAL